MSDSPEDAMARPVSMLLKPLHPLGLVSNEVWLQERTCLLMLLESRMLLRELAEYRLNSLRMVNGNLTLSEIRAIVLKQDASEDTEYVAEMQDLHRQILKGSRLNNQLERTLRTLDERIALLIQHRTSIQEIDRQLRSKRTREQETLSAVNQDFTQNRQLMDKYRGFFYALQVEPRYLARIAYVIPSSKTDEFTEAILLTLYGDAFSPREEYLILLLFSYAMEYELNHLKSAMDFIQSDTVVPKMVLTYNKRKQGVEYIRAAFADLLTARVTGREGLSFALRDAPTPEIAAARARDLESVCEAVLGRVLETVDMLPYGLRYICQRIKELILARFRDTPDGVICQLIGYFVYYRFLGLAVVAPDSFDIGGGSGEMRPEARRNLISVSKVLFQLMFRFDRFPDGDELVPLNAWIARRTAAVVAYYHRLLEVPPVEDFLHVDQYMELTHAARPQLVISLKEIVLIHSIVKNGINAVVESEDDPLKRILAQLGPVPTMPTGDLCNRDVQLSLENTFDVIAQVGARSPARAMEEARVAVIHLLRAAAVEGFGAGFNLRSLVKQARSGRLGGVEGDAAGRILKAMRQALVPDDEEGFARIARAVALSLINSDERAKAKEHELMRLRSALRALNKHREYLQNQIAEYEHYLDSCRANAALKLRQKTVKFTMKDLVRRGIVLDAASVDSSIKCFISMNRAGVFDVEARLGPATLSRITIELEDLLEKKDRSENRILLSRLVLSVPETIYLINKHFLS